MWSALLLLSLIKFSLGEVIKLSDGAKLYPLAPEYFRFAKYSPTDVPHSPPGNGESYIDISHLKLSMICDGNDSEKCKTKQTNVDFVMFEIPQEGKPWPDYWPENGFCCTTQEIELNNCIQSEYGKLIVPHGLEGAVRDSITVKLEPVSVDLLLSHNSIEKSGVYVLLLGICSPFAQPVSISGGIVSVDPYGFLPAEMYGSLHFYFIILLSYMVLGGLWSISLWSNRNEVIGVQYWISAGIVLGMLQSLMMYEYYLNWNENGKRTDVYSFMFVATVFKSSKETLYGTLLMFVSAGYGIISNTVAPEIRSRIYLWASLFFGFSLTCYLSEDVYQQPFDTNLTAMTAYVVCITLNIALFLFSAGHASTTITALKQKKQRMKLTIFYRYCYALLIFFIIPAVWSFVSVRFILGSPDDEYWYLRWTYPAVFELNYLLTVVVFAVLWTPSASAKNVQNMIELSTIEEDDKHGTAFGPDSAWDDDGELDAEYGGKLVVKAEPSGSTSKEN